MHDGTGHTFRQFGGGLQSRTVARGLWLRGETLFSRNADLLNHRTVPQQTFNVALNGDITHNTSLSFGLYADRMLTNGSEGVNPWLVRSSLRFTRTFVTGPASTSPLSGSAARHGGTGSLVGFVYTDWNANGTQDPGELPLESIPIRLLNLGRTSTSRDGQFAFVNVPSGLHQVGIDIMTPAGRLRRAARSAGAGAARARRDASTRLRPRPARIDTGRVLHDVNANGLADDGDEPVHGAVLVLDGNARSEQARGGRFRFDAVRSGEHALALLPASLPDGSTVVGEPVLKVLIASGSLTSDAALLVRIQRRPEIRKVFRQAARLWRRPQSGRANRARRRDRPHGPARRRPAASRLPLPRVGGRNARERHAARSHTQSRSRRSTIRPGRPGSSSSCARGYSAYLVEPPPTDPNAPFRVRIGFHEDRAAAERDARVLEKERGEKLWVIRER